MSEESVLAGYYKLNHYGGLILAFLGILVAGALILTDIMPATTENLLVFGGLIFLVLLEFFR